MLFPEFMDMEASRYHDPGKWGFVTFAQKHGKRWKEDHCFVKDAPDWLRHLDRTKDSYLTQAEFERRKRVAVNFLRISLCFIDLDIYKLPQYKGRCKEELRDAVLCFCADEGIPTPNLILFSGQGLYLKWFLDYPLSRRAFAKWNLVQKALLEKLEPRGADSNAIDIARVLRIERTCNTKTGEYAQVIHDDHGSWGFDDLADEVLKETGEEYRERREAEKAEREIRRIRKEAGNLRHASDKAVKEAIRKETARRINIFTVQTLASGRLWDMQDVIAPMMYGPGGVPEGSHKRNAFLFAGAVCISSMVSTTEQFNSNLSEFHRNIVPSLSWSEVKSSTSSIRKRLEKGELNKLTTEYLIEKLEVPREIQERCTTIISPEIKRERHRVAEEKKRREKGILEREEYEARRKGELEKNISFAKTLRAEGLDKKQIAKVMGKSRQSVDVYLKGHD